MALVYVRESACKQHLRSVPRKSFFPKSHKAPFLLLCCHQMPEPPALRKTTIADTSWVCRTVHNVPLINTLVSNPDPQCKCIMSAWQYKITAILQHMHCKNTTNPRMLSCYLCVLIGTGFTLKYICITKLVYCYCYCVVLSFSFSMFRLKNNLFGSRRKGSQEFLDNYHSRPAALFMF